MAEEKKPTASDILLMDVFTVFTETFAPCGHNEGDEQMTTSDISEHIEEISGSVFEKTELVQLLKENGYKYSWTDGGFKWQLKFR